MYKNIFSVLILATLFGCAPKPGERSQAKKEISEVNTGYQTESSRNYTGSASEVKNENSILTLDTYLRKIPGILVTGSGSTATVRLRGENSFVANSEPLIVLNGVVVNGGYASAYYLINPFEIKSVTALKDAASAAIYGSRASNGVVVVTLKNVSK
jgi:TonB-dependent starch-binding outer membrane protein SusC